MNNENIFSQENKKIDISKRFNHAHEINETIVINDRNGKPIYIRDASQKEIFESMRVLQNRDVVSLKVTENPNHNVYVSAIFKYNGNEMSVKLDKRAFGQDINDKYVLNNIKNFVYTSLSEISKVKQPSFDTFEAIIKNNYDIGLITHNADYKYDKTLETIKNQRLAGYDDNSPKKQEQKVEFGNMQVFNKKVLGLRLGFGIVEDFTTNLKFDIPFEREAKFQVDGDRLLLFENKKKDGFLICKYNKNDPEDHIKAIPVKTRDLTMNQCRYIFENYNKMKKEMMPVNTNKIDNTVNKGARR